MQDALIIFIKNPVKGLVKTRLAKDLGDDKALQIYHKLCDLTRNSALGFRGDKYLFYSDEIVFHDAWNEGNFIRQKQEGKDLGERMANAFETVFKKGSVRVLIIGSDCPYLKSQHLFQAINKLHDFDCVVGPAVDGGYYLLGLKKMIPELFMEKSWSTQKLLEETIQTLKTRNHTIFIMDTLEDVDDNASWERYLAGRV